MYEMNFCEQWENLSLEDRLHFQEAATRLLNSTFINRKKFDGQWNSDYLFVENYFNLFQMYFKFAGFEMTLNKNVGVISLDSQFPFAKKRIDKETTLYILALRLLYDEKSKELDGNSAIIVRLSSFIDKLLEYGIYDKKPSTSSMVRILRFLSGVNIIDKIAGKWEEVDTSFIIYPSIILLLPRKFQV